MLNDVYGPPSSSSISNPCPPWPHNSQHPACGDQLNRNLASKFTPLHCSIPSCKHFCQKERWIDAKYDTGSGGGNLPPMAHVAWEFLSHHAWIAPQQQYCRGGGYGDGSDLGPAYNQIANPPPRRCLITSVLELPWLNNIRTKEKSKEARHTAYGATALHHRRCQVLCLLGSLPTQSAYVELYV